MRSQRMDKSELDSAQMQQHQSTILYGRSLERKELQIELALAEKKDRTRHDKTQAAGYEALDGIDAFEKTLKRLGCDESGGAGLENGRCCSLFVARG
jgi:hypothetical protein